MVRKTDSLVYLNILERSQDPVALRLGIVYSDQFPEELKERARLAPSLDALRSLLQEQRQLVQGLVKDQRRLVQAH